MYDVNISNEDRQARHARGGYYAVAVASLIAAIGSTYSAMHLDSERKWTKTEAVLVGATTDVGKYKNLKITYKYVVAGKSYMASELESNKITPQHVAAIQADCEKKSVVPAFYNPTDPSQSRLGSATGEWAMIAYVALAVGSCILFVISMWSLFH